MRYSELKINTEFIGKKIYHFSEVSSTMDVARQIVENTNEEIVVIADSQSQGRGRLGRSWQSPKGGLWLSLTLKTTRLKDITTVSQLSLLTSLAVANSINKIINNKSDKLDIRLKWPNDVLLNKKKVSGILVEASKDIIIIGIGINVNCEVESFLPQLKDKVTSIKNEINREVALEELFITSMEEFERLYKVLINEDFSKILLEYYKLDCILNRYIIIIKENNRVEEGEAIQINNDGSLRVKLLPDNKIEDIYAGDVSVKTDKIS